MKNYISSLSIANYGGSHPSGSFQFSFDGGSASYTLDKEDVEKIFAVAYDLINRKKQAIANALLSVETPPLLGYDSSRTIDNETPF